MILSFVLALLAIVFSFLALNSLRTQVAGFVFFNVEKNGHPVGYFLLLGIECLAATSLFVLAVMVALNPADCDAQGRCTVTIEAPNP